MFQPGLTVSGNAQESAEKLRKCSLQLDIAAVLPPIRVCCDFRKERPRRPPKVWSGVKQAYMLFASLFCYRRLLGGSTASGHAAPPVAEVAAIAPVCPASVVNENIAMKSMSRRGPEHPRRAASRRMEDKHDHPERRTAARPVYPREEYNIKPGTAVCMSEQPQCKKREGRYKCVAQRALFDFIKSATTSRAERKAVSPEAMACRPPR